MSVKWFEEARFGMFIHWGLYSVPAGCWKGMTTPWVSEWIMNKFQIPCKEYEALAASFNPVNFNAEEWAKLAYEAGMKYIVFTTKHHEGFAMFKSTWDNYNIVDGTPFKRDVLAELAAACRKYGLKLGCYYSQDQDWHEPWATGNDWDFPPHSPEQFHGYLTGKVKHQLRELLTNYGDIGVIWFDTPASITPEESRSLKEYVHSLQPDCLVSGRIGNNMGDYITLGDNALPYKIFDSRAEGLGTMNTSWGYKADDRAWRSPEQLLETLAKMVAHNANFLLNVGPKADGSFPAEANSILERIAAFMKEGKEAVYGAGSIGFLSPAGYPWGEVTAAQNKIWLWVFREQQEMALYGVKSSVSKVTDLRTGKPVAFKEEHREAENYHKLIVGQLPAADTPRLVEIELAEPLQVQAEPYYAAHEHWREAEKI